MQSFGKSERLSGQKLIDTLFSDGKSYVVPPFRIVWFKYEITGVFPVRLLISVSKKKIKKAVDRNLIKRRIREAYRKNKSELYNFLNRKNSQCAMAVLYNTDVILTSREIEEKIILLLHRFQTEYEKSAK
jgi:ribonuclease P protein component